MKLKILEIIFKIKLYIYYLISKFLKLILNKHKNYIEKQLLVIQKKKNLIETEQANILKMLDLNFNENTFHNKLKELESKYLKERYKELKYGVILYQTSTLLLYQELLIKLFEERHVMTVEEKQQLEEELNSIIKEKNTWKK